jgi:Tfp pilus assembly protein PilF
MRDEKGAYSKITRATIFAKVHLAGGLLLLANAIFVPTARSQLQVAPDSWTTISGSVFVESENQPAAGIRVDVRTIPGGEVASSYTDSGGRFQAGSPNSVAYVISVEEPGYEPLQVRVDQGGIVSGVILTLKKSRAPAVEGYTVSVHDLSVPGKARKAFEKGIERLQKKDPAGSVAHFKEATDAFPDYYEAFYQLGLANLELRRGNEAEQALQRAIDLSGGHSADAQIALGAALCDRGAYADAERIIRRGMETDSSSWKGHLFLGQALFGQNRLVEAENSARLALSHKSDLASGYVLLANIHIRRHDYRSAITELDSFLRLKPDGPTSEQARDVRNAAERVVSRFARIFSTPRFLY